MAKQYVFIDRRKVKDCDSLVFGSSRNVVFGLPIGSYKTFSEAHKDTPEFTELDRNPNYRKVVFDR